MTKLEYQEMLWALMPEGEAWPRDDAVLNQIIEAEAAEFAKCEIRIDALLREADPRQTNEMLADFERVVGLPDACSFLGETIDLRRTNIVNKITHTGLQSLSFFEALARSLGYTVTIEEWSPFTSGLSECGGVDMVGDESVRYVWSVDIYGQRITAFVAGVAACGDPLGDWQEAADLICQIEQQKPAHTLALYDYKEVA